MLQRALYDINPVYMKLCYVIIVGSVLYAFRNACNAFPTIGFKNIGLRDGVI